MPQSISDQLRRQGVTDDTFRSVHGPKSKSSTYRSPVIPGTLPRLAADPDKDRPIVHGQCMCLPCRVKRRK